VNFRVKILLAFTMLIVWSTSARAISETEIISGFNLTVFNSEIPSNGFGNAYVKKFKGEVVFKIHGSSKIDRTKAVSAFIKNINRQIQGLDARLAKNSEKANFNVYIVDRDDYTSTVQEKIFNGRKRVVPGKCIVKSKFSRNGISYSDAVIVSDLGEALFKRCMVEEILQGLGPLNDHSSLGKSVFNDRSKHSSFTKYDRILLNVLYDERIKNGASASKVSKVLESTVRDVKARLGN